jgi:hypothetical protein
MIDRQISVPWPSRPSVYSPEQHTPARVRALPFLEDVDAGPLFAGDLPQNNVRLKFRTFKRQDSNVPACTQEGNS